MSDEDRLTIPGYEAGGAFPSPPLMPLGNRAGLPRGGAHPAPDLIGMGFLDAHALAAATGLHLSVSVWKTSIGPWGRVLDQRPGPEHRIRRRGRIAITVSGRPVEEVPDVRGLPLGDAIDRLVWLGLVPLVDSRRPSLSVSARHVLATRPAAGELLASGSVVALTVAVAPRERNTRPVSDRSDPR
mgnify:CR=1 FL=1